MVDHRPRTALLLATLLAAAACASSASQAGSRAPLPDGSATALDAAVVDTALREQTADQQVLHALNRLGFGPRPGDVARVRSMGVDKWIAAQLQPSLIPDTAARTFVAGYEMLGRTSAELLRDVPPPQLLLARLRMNAASGARDTLKRQRLTGEDSAAYRDAARRAGGIGAELASARVARAVISERQLQEVMADFWHNHFNIFAGKGPATRHYLVDYDRDVIRANALGNFRTMLGAVAESPAMLYYLDNWQSEADSTQPRLANPQAGRMAGRRGRGARGARAGTAGRPGYPVPAQGRAGAARPRMGMDMPGARPGMPRRPRRGLNENYARELLELHTLGVDGGYTQSDVIAVARAFTGWTIVPPNMMERVAQGRASGGSRRTGGGFAFNPASHDAGEKIVLGKRLAAGRGVEDGREVLDLVARHPATARYIAFKLAQRFVSDSPPPALVERAAAMFTRTNGDIRETVHTIITSPEFFSRAAYRSKVKSPFEVVVSALRAVNAKADPTPRTAQLVGRLGQPLFGHAAPDGYPEVSSEWMNAGAILNRINFGMAVAAARVPGAMRDHGALPAGLASEPRERQVDAVVTALLGGHASPDTRAVLLRGRNPLAAENGAIADSAAAGAAPMDPAASPSDATSTEPMRMNEMAGDGEAMAGTPPRRRDRKGYAGRALGPIPSLDGLSQIVGLALGSPEFQRR